MTSIPAFHRRWRLAAASALVLAAAALPFAGAAERADEARYLVYVPSRSAAVDDAANVRALEAHGFSVLAQPVASRDAVAEARAVRDAVRALLDRGVAPEAITVLGTGSGSQVAALASAVTGHRRVNYVLLGSCDERLADLPGFRMSGRVLGVRDAADSASLSCRRLWRDAPKVGRRLDLVLETGHGAVLFDVPREDWLRPVAEWSRGGRVDVGAVKVAATR